MTVALVPNAIAFRSPTVGIVGTGWIGCDNPGFGCKPQGTISLTTDGGKTWRVLIRTPRPVVSVSWSQGVLAARYDDGENIQSSDAGRHWAPAAVGPGLMSPCPPEEAAFVSDAWILCTTQGGMGNMGKSVYRYTTSGVKRVAYTPFPGGGKGYGGISTYGYPQGIAGADSRFALIWESRGTLYVTRDGGSHWIGLPKVARPEVDFGMSGFALRHRFGFVILAKGGAEKRRLIATTDAGRTWRVVHAWS